MKLAAKLAEVMGEIKYVEKKGTNTAQNYKFVRAADLANIVRQKLAKRNVIMLSDVVSAERYTIPTKDPQRPMPAIDLKVLYTFHDGDSDENISFHGYGTGADQGDKAANKAQTAALKYALRNSFLVPDEKGDPESDRKVDKATEVADPIHVSGTITREDMRGENFWWELKDGDAVYAVYTPEETSIDIAKLQGKKGWDATLMVFEEKAGKKVVYRLARITDVIPPKSEQPF